MTKLYYLVLLDCFPLFLHFLTSLIKLILWLKFFHRQKAGGGHGGQGPWGPAPFQGDGELEEGGQKVQTSSYK